MSGFNQYQRLIIMQNYYMIYKNAFTSNESFSFCIDYTLMRITLL